MCVQKAIGLPCKQKHGVKVLLIEKIYYFLYIGNDTVYSMHLKASKSEEGRGCKI